MDITNALIPKEAIDQLDYFTEKFRESGALPSSIENPAQLAMVLTAGVELGFKPVESLNSFYIVAGKVTIYGSSVGALLRQHGYSLEWPEVTNEGVKLVIHPPEGDKRPAHPETYTMEDAKRAGLTGRTNWQKYPSDMMRHKAVSRAVNFYCPEVLKGMPIKEAIYDDVELEGRVVKQADARVIDIEVAPAKFIDPKKNAEIHAVWKELADLNGWTKKKAEGMRKVTLEDKYGVESNLQLTPEQGDEFTDRIREAIKKKQNEPTEPVEPTDTEEGVIDVEAQPADAEDSQEDAEEANPDDEITVEEIDEDEDMTPADVAEAFGASEEDVKSLKK